MGNAQTSQSDSSKAESKPNPKVKLVPSECPMHEELNARITQEKENNPLAKAKLIPSGCPMHEQSSDVPSKKVLANSAAWSTAQMRNVDSQNMMPPPNQLPAPGQPFKLSTDRELSTIPRASVEGENIPLADDRWVYPSEQMFYNAMIRKGWKVEKDDLNPDTMTSIIKLHNKNNEDTWREILKWEALHASECASPRLVSFAGNANKLTPRARLRQLMGYELPFDRHDWVVDRCGTRVAYVIDYYDAGDDSAVESGVVSHLDVRPEIHWRHPLQSFHNLVDRTRVMFWRWRSSSSS